MSVPGIVKRPSPPIPSSLRAPSSSIPPSTGWPQWMPTPSAHGSSARPSSAPASTASAATLPSLWAIADSRASVLRSNPGLTPLTPSSRKPPPGPSASSIAAINLAHRHERPHCLKQEAVERAFPVNLRRLIALVQEFVSGSPNYVRSIQPLGTLLAFELHRFAFIQRLVSRVLDCGEMHEHILARRTLNKPIPLCAVEPLHYPVFFHIHSFGEVPVVRSQFRPEDTKSRLYRAVSRRSGSSLSPGHFRKHCNQYINKNRPSVIAFPEKGKSSSSYGRKRPPKQEKIARNDISYLPDYERPLSSGTPTP